MGLRWAELIEHLAERQVDPFELGQPPLPLSLGQRRKLFPLGSRAFGIEVLSGESG